MVMIIRHRQAEQCLQQAVHVSRLEEVGAARHQGHALRGVIDHHGEVVAGAEILAGEDHIALRARVAELLPPATIRSEEHTSELQSLMRISYAVFCLKKKI